MKQKMKKVIALICAIAMIVSSVTIYNNKASAAVADLPESGAGVVISVNDFGGGEVLFVAGLNTIAGASSYNLYVDGTLWGSVTNGANLELTNFPSGAHTFCVTGVNGDGEFAKSKDITVTIPTHEMVTTPDVADGTELLKGLTFSDADTTTDEAVQDALWIELGGTYTNNGDGTVSVAVPAYESGDSWATQLKQNKVQLIKDKWYKATYTVTSDVDKTLQLLVQHNVNWTVFQGEITSVSAGETKDIEVVFQATQTTDNVLFGLMMGYVNNTASEAANITISNVSLKVYNSNPNGGTEVTTADNETSEVTTPNQESQEVTTPNQESQEVTTPNQETQEVTTPQTSQSENTEAAGYSGLAYEAFLQGDTGQNQFKAVCGKGTIDKIVNIQQYGAATESGIYVAFKDADIGEITVNGIKLDCFVDGAGVIMYLSNFKYMYSDVVIKNASGTQKAVIYIYNAKGIDNSDKAITQPGGEGETSSNIELQLISPFGKYITYGSYKVLISSDKTAYAGLDPINGDHLQVQNASGSGGTQSKLTVARTFTGLTAGTRYVLSVDITPSVAQGTYTTMTDLTPKELQEGTTTVSIITKAYGDGQADFSIQLDGMGEDVILDIFNPQYREYVEGEDVNPTTPPSTTKDTETPTIEDKEPVTGDVTEPGTKPTVQNEETTTAKIKPVESTAASTITVPAKVKAPATAKIKKITAKKKTSNKIKLSLKKIKSAKGYQIAIYTTKKNAQKNKKAIAKKIVKKVKPTIKSKKLKNKVALYVRVRAYKLDHDGKTKVYGKWSKVKGVKIKK